MSAKTTADLFRERGWGVGMRVTDSPGGGKWWEVLAIGNTNVFLRSQGGAESSYSHATDWFPYTPTPPVPTREEWAELWAKLKRYREHRINSEAYASEICDLIRAIDAIASKGGDA